MRRPKTHYEQIPMEMVRKIVEQHVRRDSAIELDQGTTKNTLEEDLIRKQQHAADSGAISERES
jgi:hypothetical protein